MGHPKERGILTLYALGCLIQRDGGDGGAMNAFAVRREKYP